MSDNLSDMKKITAREFARRQAETLRGLIAAAKEADELRESAQLWKEQAFHWEKRCVLTMKEQA